MKQVILLLLLLPGVVSTAQTPFTKRFNRAKDELQEARRIIRTPDHHFLVVGYAAGVISTSSLDRDALVFKMDSNGVVLWSKKYGGKNWEEFNDVAQVGNYYYCVGYTRTWVHGRYPLTGDNVLADVFLVKLKLDGTVVWAKNMGKPGNGTSITDGNDQGQRLIASGQGGVMVVVRPNSGATSNQGGGIIWVDADGKTQWAYQYDKTTSINELTASIWKDGANTYITGGSLSSGATGGLLYKINQKGELMWDKNTRCSPGVFESQYYGYYNHSNGKIYTTDHYYQTVSTIREPQVCTNLASTGSAPASGTIPQARRFHYGTANSSGNYHRANIFPIGDGYQQFILATYELNAITINTTKYAGLICINKDLNLQWTKKIGAKHKPSYGYLNQVNDMITCDGSNQSLLAVGTVNKLFGGNTYKDILISRVTATGTLNGCDTTNSTNTTNLSETVTALSLQRINLNAGCTTACWADNQLIPKDSIQVTTAGLTVSNDCVPPPPPTELVAGGGDASPDRVVMPALADFVVQANPEHIIPVLSGLLTNLAFVFLKQPKEVYFEITDVTGNFVYERFFGDVPRLVAGFNFALMNLLQGDYVWEIEAVYEGEEGLERKVGAFKIQ